MMKTHFFIGTVALCLACFCGLKAQQRRTVLLNNQTEILKYKFESNFQMPIIICNKGVNLHQWIYQNKLNSDQIQPCYIKMNNESIGIRTIEKVDTSVIINLNQKKWEPISKPLDLDVYFPSDINKITFRSSNNSLDAYSLNKQPKLSIDYEVTKEAYGSTWGQLGGNAQHDNRIDWAREQEGKIDGLKSREVLKGQNIQFISSYQNKIIVFGKDYMALLNGNQELWHLALNTPPAKQPVISPEGKMFFVTTDSCLVTVDLNEVKLLENKELSRIKIDLIKGKRDSINNATNEITLGYDGTLYMSITNARGKFGIVALSAYPSFQPRWFYNTTNSVGPVSLSQDEKMVFFIETVSDKEEKKSRLVVLDNVSGEVLTKSGLVLGSYMNDANSYIPPVVIQTVGKDTTIVYALNGNKTSKKLYVFKLHHEQLVKEPSSTLEIHRLITSAEGMSQPTVMNNLEVLFIDGKDGFRPFNPQSKYMGYISPNYKLKKDANFETDGKIICSKSYWYYVLSKEKLFLLWNRQSSSMRSEFEGYTIDIKKDVKSVITLQDFSVCLLYTDGDIECFYPLLYENTVGKDGLFKFENKTFYPCSYKEAMSIFPMVVSESIQAIVSGPKIMIKSGFKVQKGAALTFQIVK